MTLRFFSIALTYRSADSPLVRCFHIDTSCRMIFWKKCWFLLHYANFDLFSSHIHSANSFANNISCLKKDRSLSLCAWAITHGLLCQHSLNMEVLAWNHFPEENMLADRRHFTSIGLLFRIVLSTILNSSFGRFSFGFWCLFCCGLCLGLCFGSFLSGLASCFNLLFRIHSASYKSSIVVERSVGQKQMS